MYLGCLFAACEESRSSYLKPFVLVALNSGMRRNEILSLTRTSVDWANGIANLTTTKNGDARHVPLNELRVYPHRRAGDR